MPVTLDHVQRYRELGFIVHPCCPADHWCSSPGKIPFDPIIGHHMRYWQNHENSTIRDWKQWLDYNSDINIGFLCGQPSGIIGVDIDTQEGASILDYYKIPWRRTWRYETGRGFRLLFRRGGPCKSRVLSRDNHDLEILGDGRQSVLPPSQHAGGRQYRWVDGCTPRNCELSDDTSWLEATADRDTAESISSELEDWATLVNAQVFKGGRNNRMTKLAGHLLAPHSMTADEVLAWLINLNSRNCIPPLSMGELVKIVHSIGKSEAAQVASGEREIRRIMVERGLSEADARMVWQSRT